MKTIPTKGLILNKNFSNVNSAILLSQIKPIFKPMNEYIQVLNLLIVINAPMHAPKKVA